MFPVTNNYVVAVEDIFFASITFYISSINLIFNNTKEAFGLILNTFYILFINVPNWIAILVAIQYPYVMKFILCAFEVAILSEQCYNWFLYFL